MRGLFNLDSPVMSFLNRMADLMILNILVIICSLPIVTFGACQAAMHYYLMQMREGTEVYVFRTFFREFKNNFKKATLLWLIQLFFIIVLVADFMILRSGAVTMPQFFVYLFFTIVIIIIAITQYFFPLTAKFENTVRGTVRNSVLLSIGYLPRTVGMLGINAGVLLVLYYVQAAVPLMLLFGFSVPGYLCTYFYYPIFKKIIGISEEAESAAAEGQGSIEEVYVDKGYTDLSALHRDEEQKS